MALKSGARKKAEALIFATMDALDTTGSNSEHYKKVFSKMTDKQFEDLFRKKFPLKFHIKPFEVEPKWEDVEKAAKILNVPLLEKVRLPYIFVNDKGVPVQSKECLVGYLHHKKMQQFITKKNSMSTDIETRDMRTGLLTGFDKNGKTSDREFVALSTFGLDKIIDEMLGPRADMMDAKNQMYADISSTGQVYLRDLDMQSQDSISMNLFNAYMIGAMLHSNLLNIDYMLPHTLKNRKKAISRG